VQPTGRLLEIYTNLSKYLEHESQNINASANKHIDGTTGYNIWNHSIGQRQLLDLLVGSEGTLCIITQVTLRVIPLPLHSYTLSCGINTFTDLERAKSAYRMSGVDSLTVFDRKLLSLTSLDEQKVLPPHIKKSNSQFILSGIFYRKQDEFAHHAVKSCGNKLTTLSKEIFVETGTVSVEQENAFRRYAIASHLTRAKDFSCITTLDGIAVDESENEKLAEEIDILLTSCGYTPLLGTNASLSLSSFIFFADTRTRQGRKDLAFCLARAARIVQMHKGAMTSGNGDGIIRTPYMDASSDRHTLNIFSYIQRLFDPEQLFNGGKKTFITNSAIEHYLHESVLS
jgi:FAD/FMN-containing dehydrogenase